MAALSAEEVYERHIKQLPPVERLRLLAITAQELVQSSVENTEQQSMIKDHAEALPRHQEDVTTESIVQELLAQGLNQDQIVLPGGAKGIITYIAEDFDAPVDDFKDYM